jgi:hypothetical protein
MKNILIILFASLNLVMCSQNSSAKKSMKLEEAKMKTTGDKEIDNLITTLKISMENYLKNATPAYSGKDIDQCITLLSNYAADMHKSHSKEEGMLLVKSTVLNLNALNEEFRGSLIETNEREQIAQIINLVSSKMGYSSADNDITEEWREF